MKLKCFLSGFGLHQAFFDSVGGKCGDIVKAQFVHDVGAVLSTVLTLMLSISQISLFM